MAELVYAFDLKSNGAIRTGSSPVSATTLLEVMYEKENFIDNRSNSGLFWDGLFAFTAQ